MSNLEANFWMMFFESIANIILFAPARSEVDIVSGYYWQRLNHMKMICPHEDGCWKRAAEIQVWLWNNLHKNLGNEEAALKFSDMYQNIFRDASYFCSRQSK